MEKLQLIHSLKHWCDLIWEYNQAIEKIYVYRDKLAIKLENNWYDPAELDRIVRQEYHFEINRSSSSSSPIACLKWCRKTLGSRSLTSGSAKITAS